MKNVIVTLAGLALLLTACGRAATPTQAVIQPEPGTSVPSSTVTDTAVPSATATETPVPATATPTSTATPAFPPEGRGPTGFAENVNPLTGLEVSDPQTLVRRPVVIKIENLPRSHRPQWGLSLADIVYEYYTEMGATRFASIFYGTDAEQVGPIRSGRFVDNHIVEMYKAVFVYGMAYPPVQTSYLNSTFANRLVFETNESCPALCRFDGNGQNLLVADTRAMNKYLELRNVDNTRQNLDGMLFKQQAPAGGTDGTQVFVRYSAAIYNRWDYNKLTGRYERSVDQENDLNRDNEVYDKLTDRLTGDVIAVDNVLMMCAPHRYFVKREDTEVLEIILDNSIPSYIGCDGETHAGGEGPAYLARDGQVYEVTWKRASRDSVLTLVGPDGQPFPYKPGQTWVEILGGPSTVNDQGGGVWRFTHVTGALQ